MLEDLFYNIYYWYKYKTKLVMDKYIVQTSVKEELETPNIKIKNYIMSKKIDGFIDFRPSYFNKHRAMKNILIEQFDEIFGEYLIENDLYSIRNNPDVIINDYSKDIYIKEVVKDLVILEFDKKVVLLYFGDVTTINMRELGDYIQAEEKNFVVFKFDLISVFDREDIQAYFNLTYRKVNSRRLLNRVIKLFDKHQKIKKITTEEEEFTALFSKNNLALLKTYDFDKYIYMNDDFRMKKDELLNVASVGTTGCLTGDTLIDMPRDLTKYPNGIPMIDLLDKKDFYVYTFNIEKNCIELKKCKSVWRSGIKKVYEITLESGKKIRASANHPFLKVIVGKNNIVVNRDYIRCDKLNVGDRLTTFSRTETRDFKNGEYIKSVYGKRNVLEHRFIMQELGFTLSKHSVIHHKDRNKFNNSIDNLEVLDIKEHSRKHIKERGVFGKDIWVNGEHPKGMKGKTHSEKTKQMISKNTSKALNKKDFEIYRTETEFDKKGFEMEAYQNKNNIGKSKNFHISKDEISKIYSQNRNVKYVEKIISIEEVGEENTYDMEVEDNHNFIANGIVVHNSGKTFTLNLLLLQLILGGNFKRIIYFDTQDSFQNNIMFNVNQVYQPRARPLQEYYFKITENNFYLSEIDAVNSINFLLETKGYTSGEAKGSVVKVEYDDWDSFKEAVTYIISTEKSKLSVTKDLNKLEDLESVKKFMDKVQVKKSSIFDDLEAQTKFFGIFSFQNTLFYEVSCYLYLQKLKELLYSRDEGLTYFFADETQKYLTSSFLKKVLEDLVKEKRQFGFRFYYTGLTYQDINSFVKFTQKIIFNSFNDPYLLNQLKSMSSTPIENMKTPIEKVVWDTQANAVKKTDLRLNILKTTKMDKALFDKVNKKQLDEEQKEIERMKKLDEKGTF